MSLRESGANGMSVEQILQEYPLLEADDIRQALNMRLHSLMNNSIRWPAVHCEMLGGYGLSTQHGPCPSSALA